MLLRFQWKLSTTYKKQFRIYVVSKHIGEGMNLLSYLGSNNFAPRDFKACNKNPFSTYSVKDYPELMV